MVTRRRGRAHFKRNPVSVTYVPQEFENLSVRHAEASLAVSLSDRREEAERRERSGSGKSTLSTSTAFEAGHQSRLKVLYVKHALSMFRAREYFCLRFWA